MRALRSRWYPDEDNPENTSVQVTIDANSINTRRYPALWASALARFSQGGRLSENHLQEHAAVERTGDNTAKLVGDLTIRDVTREITLAVKFSGRATSPWGVESAGFTASTKINREEWGLTWNASLDRRRAGGQGREHRGRGGADAPVGAAPGHGHQEVETGRGWPRLRLSGGLMGGLRNKPQGWRAPSGPPALRCATPSPPTWRGSARLVALSHGP